MAKKKEVVITCNATNVKAVIEGLERGMAALAKEEEHLLNVIKQRGYAENDEKKRLKELEKAMDAMRTNVQKNREEQKKLAEVMKDLSGAKLKDLKKALQEGKAALNNMSARDPGREKLVNDLKRIQKQIETNTGALKKNQSAWGALGTTMKNLFAYAGIFAGFNMLKAKLTEAYEANKRFSDSMANVRKVSGLTMDEIGKLANNLSKIDSRTGLGGLMDLSYTGAKLGFGNYGIEGLESFAKSAVKVQNALSEDMGADAMTALSKMVEVMGLIPKMGVERAMDATGSAIFKLASTSTATGTNIVEFSKRLMGLANIAHISTQDLLAFGSAADSMALAPEVAATAFNKLISAVQKQPNLIENALSIPKGTISDLYQAGHMTEALVTIFEKMREKGGMNALMQSGVFKDLGSDGAKLVAVMATMANRVDMLNAHLAVSRQAFEEGTAVAQEYAIQMDTAAAYSERAANIWQKAFVNPEGVDTVKEFTKAWYEVSKALTSNKVAMAEVKFLLGGILELLKGILYFLPALLSGLAVLGAGRMFVALRSSLELTRLSAVGLTLSINGLRTAWTALSAVGKANWIGAAATALFMIIEAFGMFNKKVQETTGYMKGFKKDLVDLNIEYGKAEAELRRYRRAIDEANTGSKQRLAAINTFNSKFKPYLSNLLTEKSTAKDVADAYEAINKAIRAKLALQLKEKDIEKYVAPREQWAAERRQEYEKTVRGTQNSQYGSEWITGYAQDNRGKSIRDIARDLNERIFHTTESTFNNVFSQLGSSTLNDLVRTKRKVNGHTVIDESVMSPQGRQLWAAMRYILQERSAENALRRTNKKWEPEQKLIDEMTAQQEETPYEPLQNAPDKDAIAAAKKAAQEQKQAMRKEMQDAEQNVTGIISKLEEYYRLQEAAINEARADGELTESQTAEMVRSLNILKNETLSTARRAVTTGDTTLWDKTKKQLQSYMADTSKVSQNLLHEIVDADVQVLHTSLVKFNGTKDVYGLSAGAFFDQMNAKAAGNQREAARLRAKLFSEAEKMVQQFHFIDKANEQLQKDLEQMGFITETYEQLAARLQAGITKKPDTVLSMTSRQQQARNEMTDRFNATQGIGTAMPEDIGEWFKEFTDNGQAEWSKTLPELQKWVQNTDKYKDDIQHLYDLLKQLQRGQSISMTTEQMAPTQTEIDRAISTRISDQSAFMQMGLKFVGQGTIPYTIDITNQQEALQWLKNFATDGEGELEQWAQAFPQITDMVKRIKAAEKDGSLGEAELQSLQDAMPQIEALYMKLLNYSDNVGKTIEQQVNAMMPSRAPIGVNEMTQQYQQRRNRTESKWNEQIDQANALGGPVDENGDNASAIDLKRQRDQALIDLEYQFQQQMWQIREQMGTTVFEQYNNELAMYKNMLDKKLISERQFQQKKGQLQMKLGLNMAQQYNGMMSNMVNALQEAEIASVEAKYDAEINAAQAAGRDTTALEEQKEAEIYEVRKKYAGLELAVKISEIIASTAVAIMQAFAQLGPVGGAIAAALLTVTGAAQLAIAKAEYDKVMSSGGGGSKKSTSSAGKTKLVSGMLTYDQGNADRVVSGPRRKLYDDGSVQVYDRPDAQRNRSAAASSSLYPGTDGHIYRATPQPALPDGVQLIRRPIATTVNGQPSLVAERGPEIIIGRRATRHIQMNEPGLLHHLAAINGRYRTYDQGTVPATVPLASPSGTPAASPDGSPSGDNPRVAAALEQNTQMMLAMQQTIAALSQTVTTLQQRGIPAHIQKYGTGGLIDEVKSGLKFDQRYNR